MCYPALLGSIVIALGTAALVGYAAGIPVPTAGAVIIRCRFTPQSASPCWAVGSWAWRGTLRRETGEAPAWLPALAAAAI